QKEQTEAGNIFWIVIRPLFSNLREVYRYTNSLRATLEVLKEEVSIIDVLALEAIRITQSNAFTYIVDNSEAFAPSMAVETSVRSKKVQPILGASLEAMDAPRQTALEFCRRIFPHTKAILGDSGFVAGYPRPSRTERRVDLAEFLR